MAKGQSKTELIRNIKYSKLPMEEIGRRLARPWSSKTSPERLLASENPTRVRVAGVVSGMQSAKSLFSLKSLGIDKQVSTQI